MFNVQKVFVYLFQNSYIYSSLDIR